MASSVHKELINVSFLLVGQNRFIHVKESVGERCFWARSSFSKSCLEANIFNLFKKNQKKKNLRFAFTIRSALLVQDKVKVDNVTISAKEC